MKRRTYEQLAEYTTDKVIEWLIKQSVDQHNPVVVLEEGRSMLKEVILNAIMER